MEDCTLESPAQRGANLDAELAGGGMARLPPARLALTQFARVNVACAARLAAEVFYLRRLCRREEVLRRERAGEVVRGERPPLRFARTAGWTLGRAEPGEATSVAWLQAGRACERERA